MTPPPGEALVFVYNVDLTLFALASDFVHRLTSPETYPCRLCDLSYDRFTMKRDWKRFIATLPLPARFELRDRFHKKFPGHGAVALPAVFHLRADGSLTAIVSAQQIKRAQTRDQLQDLVRRAVDRLVAPTGRARRAAKGERSSRSARLSGRPRAPDRS